MGTASSYQWPKVRALIGVMLKEINNGQRTWNSSFSRLKECMLTLSDLVQVSNSSAKEAGKAAPREQPLFCKEFKWAEWTQGSSCSLVHACDPCFMFRKSVVDNTAKNCPHDPKNKKWLASFRVGRSPAACNFLPGEILPPALGDFNRPQSWDSVTVTLLEAASLVRNQRSTITVDYRFHYLLNLTRIYRIIIWTSWTILIKACLIKWNMDFQWTIHWINYLRFL